MNKRQTSDYHADPRGTELAAEIAARLERLLDLAYNAPTSEDPTCRVVGIWADKIAQEMRQLHKLGVEVMELNGEVVIQAAVWLPE